MSKRRGGLKIGKLYIPKSTLNGIGKVAGKVGNTALMVASAPEQALLNVSKGFSGGGSSWLIIGAVAVGAFFILKK
jgi:hypothetical protein